MIIGFNENVKCFYCMAYSVYGMLEYMDINTLYKMAREAQGVRQSELAKKAGIAQPTLSQFESGQFTLSVEALLAIAPYLNVNAEYLMGVSPNPFSSAGLIKMFLPEKLMKGVDYSLLEYVVEANTNVQIVILLATSGIDKIISKTVVGQLTQAVLVRDQDKNTFIFRRRSRGSYLVGEGDLQARLHDMAKDGKRTVSIKTHRIPRTLAKRIADWDVTLKDVEDLFESKIITKNVSVEENRIIDVIREEGINPEEVARLLREMKRKKN